MRCRHCQREYTEEDMKARDALKLKRIREARGAAIAVQDETEFLEQKDYENVATLYARGLTVPEIVKELTLTINQVIEILIRNSKRKKR